MAARIHDSPVKKKCGNAYIFLPNNTQFWGLFVCFVCFCLVNTKTFFYSGGGMAVFQKITKIMKTKYFEVHADFIYIYIFFLRQGAFFFFSLLCVQRNKRYILGPRSYGNINIGKAPRGYTAINTRFTVQCVLFLFVIFVVFDDSDAAIHPTNGNGPHIGGAEQNQRQIRGQPEGLIRRRCGDIDGGAQLLRKHRHQDP